jgi:hypothetical protein
MAIFRGITAEEEAASGLMFCLRELHYAGAEKLRPHNHIYKHAVYPFMRIVGLFFGQVLGDKLKGFRLLIKDEDGLRRLTVAFPVSIASEDHWAYPIPPLNFGVKVGSTEQPPSYQKQISDYVAAKGNKNVRAYLKNEANLRNEILYASSSGYPEVKELKPKFLQEKASHVVALLQAYLMIAPYRDPQPYVQDALAAFTMMVGALENTDASIER